MTHPEELLAGYVDGTLPAHELSAVRAHLAECPRCRQEITLAASALSALRSLTQVAAPTGVATRALAEAGGAPKRRTGETPRWYRIGGIAAAAAALLVLAVTLPRIGKSTTSISDTVRTSAKVGVGGGAPVTALAASAIEIQQTNYDDASLSALTASYTGAGAAAGFSTSTPGATQSAAVVTGTPAQTAKALACIVKSAPSETGQPARLISARFQGTPAYLEVFLEGPGADQPADSVVVWVFATKNCAILSFSQARL
jgi:hypothetical protein